MDLSFIRHKRIQFLLSQNVQPTVYKITDGESLYDFLVTFPLSGKTRYIYAFSFNGESLPSTGYAINEDRFADVWKKRLKQLTAEQVSLHQLYEIKPL